MSEPLDDATWTRLAGQPPEVIRKDMDDDTANRHGLYCGLGNVPPHDVTTCPGQHS